MGPRRVQSEPFPSGGGFVHVLVLVLVPSPQETEQSPQGVHSVYPPSTARRAIENRQEKITDMVETNTVKDTNVTHIAN